MAMRTLRTALLAGVATLGLDLTGAALAQNLNTMTVRLPNGGLAEIRYVGDVPPRVVFLPQSNSAFDGWTPVSPFFVPESPFAMMDRISAEMDRRAAAMFRQAETIATQARSGPPIEAAFGNLSPGSQSYSYVSTMSGNGVCTQSTRITSTGNGPPKVESSSSGNCGPGAATHTAPAGSGAVRVPVGPMVPAKQPDLILTQNNGAKPYAGMIRQVAAAPR
jgi:hypothetical protein